jgi:hypothetical protein
MRRAVFILVSMVVLAVAAPASASTGLSGWWPFYEGSGTTAHDLSGNHDNGTINGAQWTTGYFGSGLSFNGNGANVDVPDSSGLEPSTAVSVTAYVKANGSPGDFDYIVSKGAMGCIAASYGLYTGPNGGLMFYVDNSDGSSYTRSPDAGTGIWDGNWHFVVGTYDGNAVHLYVDGTEIGSGTPNTGPLGYGDSTSNDLFIGHYPGCSGLDFSGSIDEPTVWNRALSAAAIHTGYLALTVLHRVVSQLPSFPMN